MTADYIRNIETLASQFADRDVTVWFPDFETEPPAGCLNQVYGSPVGVPADRWPKFAGLPALLRQAGGREADEADEGDLRMEHLWTIDLRGLSGVGAPRGARVMQLFVSNAHYNEAWTPGNEHTRVVYLGEEDVARGAIAGEPPRRAREREPRRFSLVAVTVPIAVFGKPGEGSPLAALRDAIWKAPMRLGGDPIWLQGDPDEQDDYSDYGGDDEDGEGGEGEDGEGDDEAAAAEEPLGVPPACGFMLQFDETFVDVNLGDCGVMYVSGNDAHFQCY